MRQDAAQVGEICSFMYVQRVLRRFCWFEPHQNFLFFGHVLLRFPYAFFCWLEPHQNFLFFKMGFGLSSRLRYGPKAGALRVLGVLGIPGIPRDGPWQALRVF